jgi:hypothetical protein
LKEKENKREAKLKGQKKRKKKKNYKQLEKYLEQLAQFILNHLHQGHLLCFERMRALEREKTYNENFFRLCNVLPLWEKDLKKHCKAFKNIFHPMHFQSL